ncbi:ATP-binding cassette domain-containing protein [Rossellomorea marisflavi]|uniref:ATP-binding cassette domain-containing protein n=1 Tax=Rossellomorea marisflavi TaxID=189381 RepID=UPI002079AC71|nr:ATP-binding cassette domain-containing protein [Rossellomorea marisflavi]USK92424.1 ATP-binding cassette domain-containing protein [Rossellomorea marisflavi]
MSNLETKRTSQPVRIDLAGASKRFGDKEVLKNIELTVEKNEFVAIIGKSGSGKSTLLRLVAGLEPLSDGELLFNGKPAGEEASKITMMYQDSRLLPWKTVIQNVGLGLKGDWKARAESVLEAVGLLSYKDQWPSKLSGGQKQRVALARALIHEPSLLLLDEPLSALDAFTKLEMQNLVETIWQGVGFTALLVTHDVREAIRLADRIVLVEDGRIALNVKVNAARPRQVSSPELVALEERVLSAIMKEAPPLQEKKFKTI